MAIQSDYWTAKFVKEDVLVEIWIYLDQIQIIKFQDRNIILIWRSLLQVKSGQEDIATLKWGIFQGD